MGDSDRSIALLQKFITFNQNRVAKEQPVLSFDEYILSFKDDSINYCIPSEPLDNTNISDDKGEGNKGNYQNRLNYIFINTNNNNLFANILNDKFIDKQNFDLCLNQKNYTCDKNLIKQSDFFVGLKTIKPLYQIKSNYISTLQLKENQELVKPELSLKFYNKVKVSILNYGSNQLGCKLDNDIGLDNKGFHVINSNNLLNENKITSLKKPLINSHPLMDLEGSYPLTKSQLNQSVVDTQNDYILNQIRGEKHN